MALFNFGKKKEKTKESACGCGMQQEVTESSYCKKEEEVLENNCCQNMEEESESNCCESMGNVLKSIKVLGSGCKSCHELFENCKNAVEKSGLSVEVEYVTDLKKIMEYGAMSMPALVVNEKVVTTGKVLKVKEVENLLRKSEYY